MPPMGQARWRMEWVQLTRWQWLVTLMVLMWRIKAWLELKGEVVGTVIWSNFCEEFCYKEQQIGLVSGGGWEIKPGQCLVGKHVCCWKWSRREGNTDESGKPPGGGVWGINTAVPLPQKEADCLRRTQTVAKLAIWWGKYKVVLFWLFREIKQDH